MTTIAYHGDETFRTALISAAEEHQRMDHYIAGQYWDEAQHKGCSVGCSVESVNRLRGLALPHDDHQALADAIGFPLQLVELQDAIFEGLPADQRPGWTARFFCAAQAGADLSRVWPQMAIFLLRDCRPHAEPAGQAAIDTVIGLHERRLRGDEPRQLEWDAAGAAAWAAAWDAARAAAWAAARAAAWAAARAAAWAAARAAAWAAARAAAWDAARAAARAAAWDAARAAAFTRYADELVRLMGVRRKCSG